MLAFAFMLIDAAEQAGMKTPTLPRGVETFDRDAYPHFDVFCKVQLARPMQPGEHWENAKVVASVPEDEIRGVTLEELVERGLIYPARSKRV